VRKHWLSVAVLVVSLGSTAHAQITLPDCGWRSLRVGGRANALTDSLRAVATRLYPEVLTASRHNSFSTVVFVLDSTCQITHRAIGTRRGRGSADSVIARLIPEVAGFAYHHSGFAALAGADEHEALRMRADPGTDLGIPWLVWGVNKGPKAK
jgi:hypothetical protein